MSTLIDNSELFGQVESALASVCALTCDEELMSRFTADFALRFCWSSNAIEGNTLSLEETVAFVEHDEVKDGHTYSEYTEAKNLYRAIRDSMIPFRKQEITEEWIKENNGKIYGADGGYRTVPRAIGTLIETVFVPPSPELIPSLMREYCGNVNFKAETFSEKIEGVAISHLKFERIHPFFDGNGRTGRMIMNQQLINHGLLPVAINRNSDYRASFKRYDRNGDASQLVHVILAGELEAVERLKKFKEIVG